MKITKDNALELGAIGVAVVAIALLIWRGGASTPNEQQSAAVNGGGSTVSTNPFYALQPDSIGPDYLTYNMPKSLFPLTSQAVSNTTNGTCGCTGGQQALLPGNAEFSDYLAEQEKGLIAEYQANILSTMPDYFRQFLQPYSGALSG